MEIIKDPTKMQGVALSLKNQGKTIAIVPTMGFLHDGHLALVDKAKEIADIVITSLFVNPKQFAPNEDFDSYPRDFEHDQALLKAKNVDYLFAPDALDMYPIGFSTSLHISGITEVFEGTTRPTHFDGVALVVLKLLEISQCNFAIFGQKDYQQTLVVKRMIADLNLPVQMVICPIYREPSGLAMSSRNRYLTDEEKEKASIIFLALEAAKKAIAQGERKRKIINSIILSNIKTIPNIKIDYINTARAESLETPDEFFPGEEIVMLVAVYVGRTRLIDNALIKIPTAL
ncbi:MAG TPA: pantoate--beta-alanine ligase [Bacteroidota bacterium]|nr:pantoate--beta-alanine ligase [Candidatus Kapabacteria bacterium]HRS01256.1 pantoate--beta-alanine ligase [Bacteroidota bacterium]HRT67187.1 pantoate--beta-alanine ligase [Bacteroidota bacterium]